MKVRLSPPDYIMEPDLNQSQIRIYIDTGLGSAANTVIGTKIEVQAASSANLFWLAGVLAAASMRDSGERRNPGNRA